MILLAGEVNGIKALQPKCIQTIDKMGKDMKKAATTCTNTFSLCKKAEDASLKHINDCMNFETQNLNYTQIHANADIDGF